MSPSHRPVARRGLLLGLGGLLGGGLLSSCGSEPEPPPAPPAGPSLAEPTPVTTVDQFESYVVAVHEAVVTADDALDESELSPRVTGSAAAFRAAAYEMIEEVEEWAEDLTVPGDELMVPMTSIGEEFPRVAIALVSDSVEGDEGVPYFMALEQKDAQSPYTSWGWAQQAVGIEMPMVPSEQVGAEPVARDADDLVMTPADALELYAKVLSDGSEADPDEQIAENPFQSRTHENIQAERAQLNAGVSQDEAATIKEVFAVDEDEFVGLRTDDGGAIVMATLTSRRRVNILGGATMRYSEEDKYTETAGTMEFTEEYIRRYGTTIALHIPPADSDAQVQPIGATQTVIEVSGS